MAILNFLDLPPPEEEPAPKGEANELPNGSSKTSKSSIGADFLPMLSTAGLADSDSDEAALEGRFDVLATSCEPPPEAFPGLPTHVILRVLKIRGLSSKLDPKGIPGREGLGFFLEEKNPLQRSTVPCLQ